MSEHNRFVHEVASQMLEARINRSRRVWVAWVADTIRSLTCTDLVPCDRDFARWQAARRAGRAGRPRGGREEAEAMNAREKLGRIAYEAYQDAAEGGLSTEYERLHLMKALRGQIDELTREANGEGLPPMPAALEERLLGLGEIVFAAVRNIRSQCGDFVAPPRPALFLEDDCVNVVLHYGPTAKRLSFDLPWSGSGNVDIYVSSRDSTTRHTRDSLPADLVMRHLLWLMGP